MRVYLLLLLVSAAVTYLLTPLARWVALRTGAITAVRDRDVHVIPTPRLGGVAMFGGMAVALLLASRMPFLEGVFTTSSSAWAILAGAGAVTLLGAADDVWDLDWFTKLVGQVLAAGLIAFGGIQLYAIPFADTLTIGSSYFSLGATVLTVVVAINAVNFVDGLDGLAAGLIAIGGTGFFVYTYLLTTQASSTDYSNLATLVVAVLVGACLGFLPHNFHPARIFMGDSGSMLIGLTIAAATIVVTGQIDTVAVSTRQAIPAFLPILLPVAVLLLPLLDMGLAVVRRLGAGRSPFHPDRRHLHHRLLQLGHSHRRAVLIMYVWTALFAFGGAALVVWSVRTTLWVTACAALLALAVTLGPVGPRGRSRPRPAAEPAATLVTPPAAAVPPGVGADPGTDSGSDFGTDSRTDPRTDSGARPAPDPAPVDQPPARPSRGARP